MILTGLRNELIKIEPPCNNLGVNSSLRSFANNMLDLAASLLIHSNYLEEFSGLILSASLAQQ